jgi:hypothetical protein
MSEFQSYNYARAFDIVPDRQDLADIETTGKRVLLRFTGDEINKLFSIGVVVEMYPKLKFGRQRRAYLAEFTTKEERTKVYKWYVKFYQWYLVKGVPENVAISGGTLVFLQRMCRFFGEL